MNILDATRLQVRSYPGGLDAIAPRLNKAPSTLEKEMIGASGYKLGAQDAADISSFCAQLQTADALLYPTAVCALSHVILFPLPVLPSLPVSECMLAVARASNEAHELITEACAALADNKVSDNELKKVDRAIAELVASAQTMRRAFAELNHAGKPKGRP